MVAATGCRDRLEKYLREHHATYEVQQHREAYTAQEIAAAEHVSGSKFAKVVMVVAGGDPAMLVLPAPRMVDLARAQDLVGQGQLRLAQENEFQASFPDCEPGAMPPFGNLYGVPVFVDESLTHEETIYFQAGSHEETMSVPYGDFARLVEPTVGNFANGS
jgi:Ala-tRNA(Pro) deacylase